MPKRVKGLNHDTLMCLRTPTILNKYLPTIYCIHRRLVSNNQLLVMLLNLGWEVISIKQAQIDVAHTKKQIIFESYNLL